MSVRTLAPSVCLASIRPAFTILGALLFFALAAVPASAQIAPLTLAANLPTSLSVGDLMPAISALPTGEVMVVTPGASSNVRLEARFFASDGSLVATRLLDDQFAQGHTATNATTDLFLAVWIRGEAPNRQVVAQWLTGAGSPLGGHFVVGADAEGDAPSAACNTSGCLVVWNAADGQTLARRLSDQGVPEGDTFSLPGTPRKALSLALTEDNRIGLGWVGSLLVLVSPNGQDVFLVNEPEPFVQVFAADGAPLGNPLVPIVEEPQFKRGISSTSRVSLAWNADDELVAVWDRGVFGEPNRIYSRHLSAVAVPLGDPVLVHESPASADDLGPTLSWSVTQGFFITAWHRTGDNLVTVRLLSASGQPRGNTLVATAVPANRVSFVSQAFAGSDRLWLTWQSGQAPDAKTLHLQPWLIGEPTCSRPFEIPNGSIPCAEVLGGRFKVFASFRRPDGTPTEAPADAKTDRAAFVFFNSIFNPELAVKMLDGRPVNGNFWLFYGAMSNQEYVLSAFDTETGATRVYYNPPGRLASVGDTAAFPGGTSAAAVSEGLEEAPVWQGIELVPEPIVGRTTSGTCVASQTVMCLQGGRFSVAVDWRVSPTQSGQGQMQPLTDQGGYVTFFNPANMELALKVLDGTAINGRFWVFYASMTNVEFTLTVTDHETGQVWQRQNPPRTMASVADTNAL